MQNPCLNHVLFLFWTTTATIITGCPIDMTPKVPPGTTPVEGETPGTFVQNNVFEGPQYVEEVPDDDKLGPPDDVYKSVEPGPDVRFELGHYLDMLRFAICETITLACLLYSRCCRCFHLLVVFVLLYLRSCVYAFLLFIPFYCSVYVHL